MVIELAAVKLDKIANSSNTESYQKWANMWKEKARNRESENTTVNTFFSKVAEK